MNQPTASADGRTWAMKVGEGSESQCTSHQSRWSRSAIYALIFCMVGGFMAVASRAGRPPATQDFDVTAVQGHSWLTKLHQQTMRAPFGRMGGAGLPTVSEEPQPLGEGFNVSGADLYRYNCQSCHGAGGEGLPGGEINSLIGPVWATSPAAIRRRLEDRGLDVDPAQIRQLASQAEAGIRQRLEQGGQRMPPFSYLQPKEVDALLVYLRQLTGVPGADQLKPVHLTLRPVRVGEEIVKGTCRICHDATGPGPGDLKLTAVGVIPSLASFVEDRSLDQVVRKVRYGWPVQDQQAGHRGEMPLFSYLNSRESAAIYVYLASYTPKP